MGTLFPTPLDLWLLTTDITLAAPTSINIEKKRTLLLQKEVGGPYLK